MGKKSKIGKQRRDKFYHLAKEAGYRSRAAFKLIQLNKRFEFLQSSRATVDLCAAPGGWMQVAAQNMPVSSLVVGVDLAPIKPIRNCIALQGDITTEKTRQAIKKELQTWDADTVLHDGAPNVGQNWIHDAYQQNLLVLSALKLATQILKKNGTFVTKVFRSNDYHYLITTFEKLFKKVHVWKPAASRLESAEIFVVCEKYFKPTKVPPELLDPKKVFLDANLEPEKADPQKLLNPVKKQKRAKAEGYAEGQFLCYKTIDATEFIEAHNYLEKLSEANSIKLDQEKWMNSPATTDEIKMCLADIKVCGPSDLRRILQWRKKMIAIVDAEKKELEEEDCDVDSDDEEMKMDDDEKEDKELQEIEAQIAKASADERAALKKKKKKMLREKRKFLTRKQLQMVHEGDDTWQVEDEQDMFSLARIRKAKQLNKVMQGIALPVESDNDDEEMEEEGLGDGEWETMERTDDGIDSDSDKEMEEDDDEDGNGLLVTEESYMTKEEKKETRADRWFNQDDMTALLGDDDDDDDEMDVIEKHMKRKGGKKMHENTVSFDGPKETAKRRTRKEKEAEKEAVTAEEEERRSAFFRELDADSDEEFIDEDKRIAKRKADDKTAAKKSKLDAYGAPKEKKRKLTPEQLAMGEQLIYSSKTARELEEWGWNRYTNNDEDLPDWFVDDEKKHYKKALPVTKAQVQEYRDRLKELNARPIKKVAEAKARKARRAAMRLEKAKKKAESVAQSESMEHIEKVKEMKKIMKSATKTDKKEVSYQVMTKGKIKGGNQRPNGKYKLVDRRMKSDKRSQKSAGRGKGGKGKGRGMRGKAGRK